MKRFLVLGALVCCVLLLAACGRKQEKLPQPVPMKVGTGPVHKGDIVKTLDLSGTLTYVANTTVSSEVSAQVNSILVGDGKPVTANEVLLVFDETKIRETANQAQANLQKDEATLSFSKTEWEKNAELVKSGSISQTQYDQKFSSYRNALAQVEADKAVLAKALEDLKKTQVRAPIPGLLSDRYVEKGDWVSEGGKLFQISDYSKIRLEAFLSDMDVGKLDLKRVFADGVPGELTVDSYPGKVWKGNLTYVQPVANQARLFQVRIYLDNPDMLLLQGMFARARIPVEVIPGVMRMPLNGLLEQVRENDFNTVFVVDPESKAKLTRIKIGATDPVFAQVLEGLKEGDMVVVRGKEALGTGQLLAPTLLETAPKEPPPPEKAPEATGQNVPACPESPDKSDRGLQK